MQIALAIYNFLILMLFAVALSASILAQKKTKNNIYFVISIMFLFYIFDNTLIYLTELFNNFAETHDQLLIHVPSFKLIIFTVTNICWMYINQIIIDDEISIKHYFWVIVCAVFTSMVPLFSNGATEIWLFFTPCQIFLFGVALYGYKKMKKYPEKYLSSVYKAYKKLLVITMVFCVLIVIEDTIVIFNFDIYEDFMVKVHNRSLTDDILSIIYAVAFLKLFIKYDLQPTVPVEKNSQNEIFIPAFSKKENSSYASYNTDKNIDETPSELEQTNLHEESFTDLHEENSTDSSEENEEILDYNVENSPENIMFNNFCNKHLFTEREKEIFELMIQNKSNQEISDELFISIGTVKTHIHNIYNKVDVKKKSSLMMKYYTFEKENNTK